MSRFAHASGTAAYDVSISGHAVFSPYRAIEVVAHAQRVSSGDV